MRPSSRKRVSAIPAGSAHSGSPRRAPTKFGCPLLEPRQVLGYGPSGLTAGRGWGLRRSGRHPPGRRDRRRASPALRTRPHRLQSLALRAGVDAQTGRAAQRCAVPGLGPADGVEPVRQKLAAAGDGDRQMVDILNAVSSNGPAAVEAACAEALAGGTHSAMSSSTSSPAAGGPAAVAPIRTPEALRLAFRPVAACARYDRLREGGHAAP